MNKAQLVETARKELNMTLTIAEKTTVIALREMIRSRRELTNVETDPFAKAPKGLEKMCLAELKEEILMRDLPEPSKPTRASMILLVRDDVMTRQTLKNTSSTTEAAASTSNQETSGRTDVQDEDYEMVDGRAVRRR